MDKTHIVRVYHPSGKLYEAWCDFVNRHPCGTFFQSDVVFRHAATWPGTEPLLLLLLDGSQRLQGSLLALIVGGQGMLGRFSRTTLVYGGPVLEPRRRLQEHMNLDALLKALISEVKNRSACIRFVNMHDWSDHQPVFNGNGFAWLDADSLLLGIPNKKKVWDGLHEECRNRITESLEAGASVHFKITGRQLEEFYDLLQKTSSKRARKALPSLAFFMALTEEWGCYEGATLRGGDRTRGRGHDDTTLRGGDDTKGRGDDDTTLRGGDRTRGRRYDETTGRGDDGTKGDIPDDSAGTGLDLSDKNGKPGNDDTTGRGDEATDGLEDEGRGLTAYGTEVFETADFGIGGGLDDFSRRRRYEGTTLRGDDDTTIRGNGDVVGGGFVVLVEYRGRIVGGAVCPLVAGRLVQAWLVAGKDQELGKQGVYPGVLSVWTAMECAMKHKVPFFSILDRAVLFHKGIDAVEQLFGGDRLSYGRFVRNNYWRTIM